MIQSLLRKIAPRPRRSPADVALMARAAELLAAPAGPLGLAADEADVVVRYMHPARFSKGTTFIREGDAGTTGFLLLVVEGEVVVESIVVSRRTPVTLRVLGPGTMHGDVGLIDGLPRSASCTADSQLEGAILTRDALHRMMQRHPRVCCKLLAAIATGMGARLRDSTATLKRYVQLTRTMQQEIDRLLPT